MHSLYFNAFQNYGCLVTVSLKNVWMKETRFITIQTVHDPLPPLNLNLPTKASKMPPMIPYICPLCVQSFNPRKRTPPVSVHLCICPTPRVSAYGRFECIQLNSISQIKYSINLISQSSKGSLQPKIPGKQTSNVLFEKISILFPQRVFLV